MTKASYADIFKSCPMQGEDRVEKVGTRVTKPLGNPGQDGELILYQPIKAKNNMLAVDNSFTWKTKIVNLPNKVRYRWSCMLYTAIDPGACARLGLTFAWRGGEQIMKAMAACGHDIDTLGQIFGSLPAGLQRVIEDMLRASAVLAGVKAQSRPAAVADAPPAEQGSEGGGRVVDYYDDQGIGWWSIQFDPITGQRTLLETNNTFAKMMGLHPEEALARAGHGELEVPMSQLEFLCTLMNEMCSAKLETRSCTTTYFRLTQVTRGRVQVRERGEGVGGGGGREGVREGGREGGRAVDGSVGGAGCRSRCCAGGRRCKTTAGPGCCSRRRTLCLP